MPRLRKPKASICHVVYVEARSGMSVAGCDGAQEFLEVVVTPEAGGNRCSSWRASYRRTKGTNARKTISVAARAMTPARVPTCCALSTVLIDFLLEVEQFLDSGVEDLCDVPGQLERWCVGAPLQMSDGLPAYANEPG